MNKKILWKIEALWEKYHSSKKNGKEVFSFQSLIRNSEISNNYVNGISKHHPRFHVVDDFDFTESEKPVFSDDQGEYLGLDKCQVTEKNGKLIYLFDNHNEMLYPIVEIASQSRHDKAINIVHIDAHPDDAKFEGEKIKELGLENVSDYIALTRISDFFDAVSEARIIPIKTEIQKLSTKIWIPSQAEDDRNQKPGMSFRSNVKQSPDNTKVCHPRLPIKSRNIIDEIYRVTHSDDFEFFLPPDEPYILSLDIDIFGPEGDFAELENKVRAIALAWSSADVVCIATSPGFIDQEFARKIIEIMTKPQ